MSKALSLYNAIIEKNKIFCPLQSTVTVPLNASNLPRLAKIWPQLLLLFPIAHQGGGLQEVSAGAVQGDTEEPPPPEQQQRLPRAGVRAGGHGLGRGDTWWPGGVWGGTPQGWQGGISVLLAQGTSPTQPRGLRVVSGS